jgi:hypothetical protein
MRDSYAVDYEKGPYAAWRNGFRQDPADRAAQVDITQPGEIALYLKAFEELRTMAVYGQAARALIVKAIDALN